MQKIKYHIYATENGLIASSNKLGLDSKVGTVQVDWVRGEYSEARSRRALDMFLKTQAKKAFKNGHRLESVRAALQIDVFEALKNGYIRLVKETSPFMAYEDYKLWTS